MTWPGHDKSQIVKAQDALAGRTTPLPVPEWHAVYPQRRIVAPFPDGLRTAVFGMGCGLPGGRRQGRRRRHA